MNKVFKASAGTGKTYSLSLEYIGALLRGDAFNEVLVMTFTRKATAEIRERILKFLQKIIKGYFSSDLVERKEALDLLAYIEDNLGIKVDDEKIKNLEKVYLDIISNKEKIEIYTIDGFINKLFKKIVTPRKGILKYDMDESEEIFEKVLDTIVNNEEDFLLFEEYFKEEKKRDIEDYLALIKNLIYSRWKHYLVGKYREREKLPCENIFFQLEDLILAIKDFAEKSDKDFDKVFRANIKRYVNLESVEEKEIWLENNMKNLVGETIWNGNQVKGAKNTSYKEHFQSLMDDIWEGISKNIYNNKIIPFERLYFQVANIVYARYNQLRFREKVFSFNDLSFYTLVAMLEGGYVKEKKLTEKFYKIYGSKFTTVFLDEFQDTSILQWKILHALVNSANYAIIVGDEKQSIYGWRGGERALFERLPHIINGEVKVLPTCYRSHTNIIDFVNEYFSHVENWPYTPVKSVKEGGYVEINIDKLTRESPLILAEKIAKERNYGAVGLLARSNKDLLAIAKELEGLNVPYLLESNQIILEHDGCKPIYNLLKFYAYRDYFALIKFLRSKVINLGGSSFRYLLNNLDEIKNFFNNAEYNLEGNLIEVLELIKTISKRGSYRKILDSILSDFPFSKVFNSESESKNINYFYSIASKFDSIIEFLVWLEEKRDSEELKRVGTEDDNAVKLMTIHKSKGLEFESEYFYWVVNGQKPPNLGVDFYLNLSYDFEEVEDYFVCDSKYKKVLNFLGLDYFALAEKKAYEEEINNLYVALTRPEKNLYCYYFDNAPRTEKFADEKKDELNSIDKALLTYLPFDTFRDAVDIGLQSGEIIESKEKTIEKKEVVYNLKKLFKFNDFVKKQVPITFENEYKRKEGLALHYFFEFIYYGTDEEVEYAKKRTYLQYSNMIGPNINHIINRAIIFVKKHREDINNKNGLFNSRWSIYNEFEVEDNGKKKRLDRLMVDKETKEAYIIDYKDSKDPESKDYYIKQLEGYKELLNIYLPDYKIYGNLLEID